MLEVLEQIWIETLTRLSRLVTNHLPGVLAALFILLVAWGLGALVRTLLLRIFKGAAVDRFLRRSGFASIFSGTAHFRTSMLVARGTFWIIMISGFLLALSAFDTQLTTRVIDSVLLLLPKLIAGGAILLAGMWVSRYLGRSTLVWAFNEGIPSARRMALAVRIVVLFVAVVVVADYLDFARNVFLAAFILLVGGAMLACGLAVGIGGRKIVERYIEGKETAPREQAEETIWKHL